jgi:hypothetical protein
MIALPKQEAKVEARNKTKQKMDVNYRWELAIRKQADFNFVKELNPEDFFEIRINSGQVTEKAVTVTLRELVGMIEDVRPKKFAT